VYYVVEDVNPIGLKELERMLLRQIWETWR